MTKHAMPLGWLARHVKAAGGTPPFPVIADVGTAIVVWQPDGEVKTLRRKPWPILKRSTKWTVADG